MRRTAFLLALLAAVATTPAARAEPAAAPAESLRHLSTGPDGWLLTGELDTIEWRVNLDAASAARGGTLVLGLESAISVMPEASTLSVAVNGRTVAQTGLGTPAADPVAVAVPPAALSAGWNTIRITATQRHRVDCGVPGVYELWTRVDPRVTGFRVADGGAGIVDLAGLARLPVTADGRHAIRLRVADRSPARLAAGFALTGAIARLAGAVHPDVEVAASAGSGPGLDLALGSPDQLAGMGIDPIVAAGAVSEPRLLNDGSGRVTLVFADGTAGAVQQLLDRLADLAESAPAPGGAVPVDGGESTVIPFSRFGIKSEQFTGRLWTRTVRVALPADALTSDYDSVAIGLDAGYAPGLSPDNRLSVFVGDRLAATVPFGNSRGEVTENRRVEMPLSLFQPGVNEVRFEAALASPDDAECDPRQQISGSPRFLILDSTTITVPRLARMARLPDLAGTIADGRDGAAADRPLRIALAADDEATVSAAATLFARMAAAGGRVRVPEIVAAGQHALRTGGIVVGAAADLPAGSYALAGVEAPDRDHPWSARPDAVAVPAEPEVTGTVGDETPLIDAWRSRVGDGDGVVDRLRRRVSDLFGSVAGLVGLDGAETRLAVPPFAGLLIAQDVTDGPDGPVTLVTAPTAESLRTGVGRLVAPQTWQRLAGRAAILDGPTDAVAVVPADETRLVASGDLDPGNLRLVLAAWFSTNSGVYGLLLLVASALFGVATYAKVRRSGVRRP